MTKEEALAQHLGVPLDSIFEGYNSNVFEINTRQEKQGSPPEVFMREAAALRAKLKELFGDQVDSWNVSFLQVQNILAKEAREELAKHAPKFEAAQETEENLRRRWLAARRSRRGGLRADWDKEIKHQGSPYRQEMLSVLATYQHHKDLQAEFSKYYGYSNLDQVIRASFKWPAQHGNEMAHEYQMYVNQLYQIMNRDTSDAKKYHVQATQAAFDGQEIVDTRELCWVNDGEYLVLTDEEVDEAWDESLRSYLNECILSELPETAQLYFDEDRWLRDARGEGRGHSLSSYDGEERQEGEYFIYRLN